MEIRDILKHVDHTLLAQTATWEEIKALCEDAIAFETASVCIPPVYVKQAARYVEGRVPICTVIGFPNGFHTCAAKVFEAEQAVRDGASELDMVIHIGAVKEERFDLVQAEIQQVKQVCGERILKVIVETCFLSKTEKIRLCHIVSDAGADYIKTSTGFANGGAKLEDVVLFRSHLAPQVKIKAAGGIRTLEAASLLLDSGADRLGASALVQLVKAQKEEAG